LPGEFIEQLDQGFRLRIRQCDPELATKRIRRWSRATAWRRVKEVMSVAGIAGTHATPKGLRHAFGVKAFQSNVPPHLVQRWLGHASLRTTAIYGDVVDPEERAFAERMWSSNGWSHNRSIQAPISLRTNKRIGRLWKRNQRKGPAFESGASPWSGSCRDRPDG
jgi:hypothetical protein